MVGGGGGGKTEGELGGGEKTREDGVLTGGKLKRKEETQDCSSVKLHVPMHMCTFPLDHSYNKRKKNPVISELTGLFKLAVRPVHINT